MHRDATSPHLQDGLSAGVRAAKGKDRFYRAYGLLIRSELHLPELEPAQAGEADVTISVGAVDGPRPEREGGNLFEFAPGRQYLSWDAVGTFLVSGNQIRVDPAPGVNEQLIAFPLLGPVIALLLHERGLLILHASAVAVGGKGAVFLGDKGAGKSTTAGLMVAAGHRLLTDDVLAIDLDGPRAPLIASGFPQLKLAEEAADALAVMGAEARPAAHPAIDKLQHRLSRGFAPDGVPPGRIYVLERAEEASIERLQPSAALAAIMRFAYVTRFGSAALSHAERARHFVQCTRLADRFGVYRLRVPHGFGKAGAAVALVERDLEGGDQR